MNYIRRTSPKFLGLRGKIGRLVVQSLREIGKDELTSADEQKVINLLKKEDIKSLLHDMALVPRWIADIMAKALQ